MVNPRLGTKCIKFKNRTDFYPEFLEGARVLQTWNVNTWEGSLREAVLCSSLSPSCVYIRILKYLGLEGELAGGTEKPAGTD